MNAAVEGDPVPPHFGAKSGFGRPSNEPSFAGSQRASLAEPLPLPAAAESSAAQEPEAVIHDVDAGTAELRSRIMHADGEGGGRVPGVVLVLLLLLLAGLIWFLSSYVSSVARPLPGAG